MKIKSCTQIAALVLSILTVRSGAEELRSDGFIRDWLLLAPIQLGADTDGAEAIDKNQIPDEAQLKPKAGDKVKVRNKELTWKKVKATDYFLDFNALVNDQTEKTLAYAVAYLKSDTDRKDLRLKMGSNDEGKVYLNGKELLKASEPRALEQDSDVARNVSLNKGINVIIFKVFNEGGSDWQGCLRFTESNGKAVTNLVVQLEP